MEILPLSQAKESDIPIIGTKAGSLAALKKLKFSVPETFVVTAEAFQVFLKKHDIRVAAEAELERVSLDDLHSVEYASRMLQDMVMGAELPESIGVEIMQQYKHINAEHVAVRSSVYTEETHSLTWSGDLKTELHVGFADLLDAVKSCWASLFAPKALYYLLQRNLYPQDIALAVIVQRMVPSSIAGICYTRHPLNLDEHQIVIEAGKGLGDPTEKRHYTPDTYTVQKAPLLILDKNIARQEIEIVPEDGSGTTMKDLSSEESGKQKMSDEQILELAKLAADIEEKTKTAVVLEWVYGEEKFWFVQYREL